jgi:hypothetical protein
MGQLGKLLSCDDFVIFYLAFLRAINVRKEFLKLRYQSSVYTRLHRPCFRLAEPQSAWLRSLLLTPRRIIDQGSSRRCLPSIRFAKVQVSRGCSICWIPYFCFTHVLSSRSLCLSKYYTLLQCNMSAQTLSVATLLPVLPIYRQQSASLKWAHDLILLTKPVPCYQGETCLPHRVSFPSQVPRSLKGSENQQVQNCAILKDDDLTLSVIERIVRNRPARRAQAGPHHRRSKNGP